MNTPVKLALAFALGGLGGWLLENLIAVDGKWSKIFGGAKVPFLPVYGLGTMGITVAAPLLAGAPWYVKGPIYSAGMTGLEAVACQIDRQLPGGPSWAYSDGACIDVPHTIAWGVLGLGIDYVVTK